MAFRRVLAVVWLVVPPLALSVLLHLSDPEVDRLSDLLSYPVLWTVLLFGVLAMACVALCLVAFLESGRPGLALATALVAVPAGVLVFRAGSGATSWIGAVWSVVGTIGLVAVVILFAVLPAAMLGWPRSREDADGG